MGAPNVHAGSIYGMCVGVWRMQVGRRMHCMSLRRVPPQPT